MSLTGNHHRRGSDAPQFGPRRQRGQALTELVVLAAVLVPLFLLVPVLAKYIHLRHANQQAARAAAWDATVSPDYALPNRQATQTRMIDRHFTAADAPIRTQPAAGQPDAALGDVFYNTFSDQPLLERTDIQLAGYRNDNAPGLMDDLLSVAEAAPGEFPPNKKGLITAEVAVRPRNLRTSDGRPAAYLAPFDSINLQMTARQTLLADAWNAKGPGYGDNPHARSVIGQVETLVPSAWVGAEFNKIIDFVEPVINLIPFLRVITRLDMGHIDPDVVPHERLERYAPSR